MTSQAEALRRHIPDGRVAVSFLFAAIDAFYLEPESARLSAIEKTARKVAAALGSEPEDTTMVVGVPSEFADLLPDQSPSIGLVVVGIQHQAE